MQRYALNPPVHLAVRAGLVPGYVIIETTGRRTGKRRHTVVGFHRDGDVGWIVAEQGRHAGYVCNLEANADVRVCLHGRWRRARAVTVPNDDPLARLKSFGRVHAATVRGVGTDLLTIRVELNAL
ncbi:MAG: hypothetical protein QOF21_2795 [Actinomycetota bacterium]|jgi:deazaflavin-dependent oxidoreductase (nitroreductase family)